MQIKNFFRQCPSGRLRSSDFVKKIDTGESQNFARRFFEGWTYPRIRSASLGLVMGRPKNMSVLLGRTVQAEL